LWTTCEKWRLHSEDSAGEELNNMYPATRMLLLCALLATPLAAQNYAPDWQSLDSRPNHPAALYMLGQGLLKRGGCAGAIGRWRRVIEINPDYAQTLYNLSRLLTKSAPEEAKRPQVRFETLQATRHIMDRAQPLGNFALASAAARLVASDRTTEGRPPTLRRVQRFAAPAQRPWIDFLSFRGLEERACGVA
jgi:hypothetical protein